MDSENHFFAVMCNGDLRVLSQHAILGYVLVVSANWHTMLVITKLARNGESFDVHKST